MTNWKKIILLIAGPGVILVEAVALFLHLFASVNTKSWLVAGVVVFFVVFVPLYAFEYFSQEFKYDREKKIHFKRKQGRIEWRGGNIHGKVPGKSEKPGKLFKD